MCVVSMISDSWKPSFPFREQKWPPLISPREFNRLKEEVEALKILLKAAKKYDEDTGQKDCEKDEKTASLRKLAEYLGVDLKEVFA